MSEDQLAVILARLEERIAHIGEQISRMEGDIDRFRTEYVRLERFYHIERIVLGLATAIGLGVLGIILPKVLS